MSAVSVMKVAAATLAAGRGMSAVSVMKNGDGKGGSYYPSMEGGESRWSMSLNPIMRTATEGKVMSLGLVLEVVTAGNVILPYHVMKITTMGNLLS